MDNNWQKSRLIPVIGSKSSSENEQRATSALLAVMEVVPPLTKSLFIKFGVRVSSKTQISTFIETAFQLKNGTKVRPDGLISIKNPGRPAITFLLEVKTGKNLLKVDQINNYIEIARLEGFDGVLTISNELSPQSGVHPTAGINIRSNSKISVFHLSWSSILTTAVMEKVYRGVDDPEQSWILGELLRYLEHPASGAMEFEDMGPNWTTVRQAAREGTLSRRDESVLDVAYRWDQLSRFLSLKLGSETGEDVQELIPKKHHANPLLRTKDFAVELSTEGTLTTSLRIPNTAADLHLVVDLKAKQTIIDSRLDAPSDRGPKASITWLLRQLKNSPEHTVITAFAKNSPTGVSLSLGESRIDAAKLLPKDKRDISRFHITLRSELSTVVRRSGESGFVAALTNSVREFYGTVLQDLKAYHAPAPRLLDSNIEATIRTI